MSKRGARHEPWEVTGRMVFICLVAFFAVIVGVNIVLVRAAISTFGGTETESSYRAGLVFDREITAAQQQNARHWRVSASVVPREDGSTVVEVTAQDASGRPLIGIEATVRFAHPTDRRFDQALVMRDVAPGRFSGTGTPTAGGWVLMIELSRAGERLFRSQNRVGVR